MICEGLVADWSEIRAWLQFLVILVSITLGLLTFIRSARQNQLSNAIKLVERFENRFRGHDYEQFQKLVAGSYVGCGVDIGQFMDSSGEKIDFGSLFSEGSLDGGASTRILQELDIVCGEWLKNTVSKEFIYSNLGHLLEFYNMHLRADSQMVEAYEYNWGNVFKVMGLLTQNPTNWRYRLLALGEDADTVYDENGTPLYDGSNDERWKI